MTLEIHSREWWGAPKPRWSWKLYLPVSSVFTSFTYTNTCFDEKTCLQELQFLERHATQGKCPAIRYNFLIGGDGSIYEGRGWYSRPGLPPKYKMYNKQSIYIGIIGFFRDYGPSDQMYQARDDLVYYGVEKALIRPKHLSFNILPAGRGIFTQL